eukprot:TRINITY_DN5338_c0_g1_i1.p1 TRINITY_DN5338_c0_g1~~TRINITY_DN5338_c0_g1_i1.p1  ORF type:complete len:50 (+),score=12.31 TRINITY_DN5338_c0_g1_i1:124-273(+)
MKLTKKNSFEALLVWMVWPKMGQFFEQGKWVKIREKYRSTLSQNNGKSG